MDSNISDLDRDVLYLSSEISAYLTEREGAADTFEGLVSWWLFRQKMINIEEKMRSAIQYLCTQGVIKKRTLSDGSIVYIACKT
ncbi:MAG: hypothetical protein AAFZ92_02370 [Pseudomonadota bacterium]